MNCSACRWSNSTSSAVTDRYLSITGRPTIEYFSSIIADRFVSISWHRRTPCTKQYSHHSQFYQVQLLNFRFCSSGQCICFVCTSDKAVSSWSPVGSQAIAVTSSMHAQWRHARLCVCYRLDSNKAQCSVLPVRSVLEAMWGVYYGPMGRFTGLVPYIYSAWLSVIVSLYIYYEIVLWVYYSILDWTEQPSSRHIYCASGRSCHQSNGQDDTLFCQYYRRVGQEINLRIYLQEIQAK